ncbi:hypothetical protein ACWEBX_28670 [Streptomyces sp. NPDC005070]
MPGARLRQIIGIAIGGGFVVVSIALRMHSWQERGFAAAFLLGACSFALWALTVAVASLDDSSAWPAVAVTGQVALTGALVTLTRRARLRTESGFCGTRRPIPGQLAAFDVAARMLGQLQTAATAPAGAAIDQPRRWPRTDRATRSTAWRAW